MSARRRRKPRLDFAAVAKDPRAREFVQDNLLALHLSAGATRLRQALGVAENQYCPPKRTARIRAHLERLWQARALDFLGLFGAAYMRAAVRMEAILMDDARTKAWRDASREYHRARTAYASDADRYMEIP